MSLRPACTTSYNPLSKKKRERETELLGFDFWDFSKEETVFSEEFTQDSNSC
jgi:hypothetical protein